MITEISFVLAYIIENFRVTWSPNGLVQLFKKSHPGHPKILKENTQLSGFTVTSFRPGNGQLYAYLVKLDLTWTNLKKFDQTLLQTYSRPKMEQHGGKLSPGVIGAQPGNQLVQIRRECHKC